MLIVTQTKGKVVNLDGTEMVFTEDDLNDGDGCRVIARGASGREMALGWYKDEARAEDVVREIVETYKTPAVKVDVMNFIIRADSSIVYEMPET